MTRRGRRVVAVAVVVAVLVIVGAGVTVLDSVSHHLFGGSKNYTGDGSGTVDVTVQDGDSLTEIGQRLATAGVVGSATAFTQAATADPKAQQIGPGTYQLHHHMSGTLAVALMLQPSSLLDYHVTIPEGFTAADIVARLAADAHVTTGALEAALHDPAELGLPTYADGHVEGYLFPATYDFPPGTSAVDMLKTMVDRFGQAASALHLTTAAAGVGLSPAHVVTLASIVQREGRLVSDYPGIAAVFLNRLKAGMNLGSDATLYYVLGPNHGPLTEHDLMLDSPYNTRLHTGFPPTAIDSPGMAALDAVLHPAHSSYLYFVTIDKAGHTAYARTLPQFNALVARSRANGVS